jgi:chemotaxis protein CheD
MNKEFINSGQLYIASEPTHIAIILGSCVGICLYDQSTNICGLNHYLLSFWNGNGLKSPKYGNISIELMIDKMLQVGANKNKMIAKVFGGANIYNVNVGNNIIGEQNILVATQLLAEHRIPIVAKDVGGTRGRKILVDSATGRVQMKYV